METNSVREASFIGSTSKEVAQPVLTATQKNVATGSKPAVIAKRKGGSHGLKRIFSAGVLLPVLAGCCFLGYGSSNSFIRSLI